MMFSIFDRRVLAASAAADWNVFFCLEAYMIPLEELIKKFASDADDMAEITDSSRFPSCEPTPGISMGTQGANCLTVSSS